MKTQLENAKWIILMLAFFMIVIGANAQKVVKAEGTEKVQTELAPPPPPPPPPAERMSMNDEMPPMPFNLPDLTDVQKEKIKKSDLNHLSAMTPLRNQMREKQARLATILSTQPINMVDADQVADELGKIGTSILKLQIRHDQELRGFLTPDQQVIFDARPKPFLNKPGMPGGQGRMKRGQDPEGRDH